MNETSLPVSRLPILAGAGIAAITPRSIEEAYRMAEAICLGGMAPDSYIVKGDNRATASRVMIGILKGLEVGLPPMSALSNICIVNNRPCIWGDAALALCLNNKSFAGHREWSEGEFNLTEKSNWTAKCEMRRLIHGNEVVTVRSFSWAEATRGGLTRKGPWQQYPQRMLQMRARAWAIRDSFADTLSGLGIVEEVQDLPVKAEEVNTSFLDTPEPERIEQMQVAEPVIETITVQNVEPNQV